MNKHLAFMMYAIQLNICIIMLKNYSDWLYWHYSFIKIKA